jgi:HEAT repeat protein
VHRYTRRLGQAGDARAVDPLLRALGDPDSSVRAHARTALQTLGVPVSEAETRIGALHDQDWRVRCEAAAALGPLGDARAVEPLIRALGDESEYVRTPVASALGRLGDARAVGPLIRALGDKDWNARNAVAGALRAIGASAVEPLIGALHDENSNARRAAVEALAAIDDPRAVSPLIGALITALGNEEWPGHALGALEPALERSSQGIDADLLRRVCRLQDSCAIYNDKPCSAEDSVCVISYSRVKQLARQELIRRGLKA